MAVDLSVRHFDGRGPASLLFAHATSFCKEIWEPVVAELRSIGISHPAVAWDFRGHGHSGPVQHPVDWWVFADDVRSVLAGVDREFPMVGVGHSMGGAALVMVEVQEPGTFAGFVLVEPVITRPPYERQASPMSEAAGRRRAHFESVDMARESFRDEFPFNRWGEASFEAYLRGALRPASDGGVELACSPATEAELYLSAREHGLWEHLPEVHVPIRFASSDHPGPLADDLPHVAERFIAAVHEHVPGTSHLVPMEEPAAVARLVADHVEALGLT